jgi:hypothetical protein
VEDLNILPSKLAGSKSYFEEELKKSRRILHITWSLDFWTPHLYNTSDSENLPTTGSLVPTKLISSCRPSDADCYSEFAVIHLHTLQHPYIIKTLLLPAHVEGFSNIPHFSYLAPLKWDNTNFALIPVPSFIHPTIHSNFSTRTDTIDMEQGNTVSKPTAKTFEKSKQLTIDDKMRYCQQDSTNIHVRCSRIDQQVMLKRRYPKLTGEDPAWFTWDYLIHGKGWTDLQTTLG